VVVSRRGYKLAVSEVETSSEVGVGICARGELRNNACAANRTFFARRQSDRISTDERTCLWQAAEIRALVVWCAMLTVGQGLTCSFFPASGPEYIATSSRGQGRAGRHS
jgi:hypothetical protein